MERWTLWIRLEVNTGTNDDWLEQVEFREGPKYTLYKQRKTWSEAESHCQNNSGHLASLASEKQYLDLREFASEVHEDVWLGGRNSNGSWEWSDQTPWTYTNWAYAASASYNNTCAFFWRTMGWRRISCSYPLAWFICQNNPTNVTGSANLTLEFKRDKQSNNSFHLWYRATKDKELQNHARNVTIPAFTLKWKIEEPLFKLEQNSSELGESLHMPRWNQTYEDKWYKADFIFKANLLFNDKVQEQIGNDTLMVLLEVDTREAVGWVESVKYKWVLKDVATLFFKNVEEEVTGKRTLQMALEKENSEFVVSFQLEYRYEAASQELLNSWADKRMTGFHLTWFLQDSNGVRLTNDKSGELLSWDSVRGSVESGVTRDSFHKGLDLAFQFAKQKRLKNMPVDTLVERVITQKIVSTNLLQRPGMLCSESHLFVGHDDSLFRQMISIMNTNVYDIDKYNYDGSNMTNHLQEKDIHADMVTGFKLFSALVFCPDSTHLEKLKPYKFTYNLVTSQSLPTIVQAIVNAVESKHHVAEFGSFYEKLDEMLGLQFSNVQLASSDKIHLEEILNKGQPFLSRVWRETSQCSNGKCKNNFAEGAFSFAKLKVEKKYNFLWPNFSKLSVPSLCIF